jgi:hypothetical protein
MRTGAAAGHTGYFHEAVYYRDESDLLAVVLPFLLGGVEAGEPTVCAFGEANAALVREATDNEPGIAYLAGGDMYARPASAIRAFQNLLAEHAAAGAGQIRIIGELAPWMFGETWDWWARYESAINHAYDDFPLWSMCAYDTTITPPHVLHEVARTHPWVARPDGHERSAPYIEPSAYLLEPHRPEVDPLQAGAPAVALTDPSPVAARQAVMHVAPDSLAPTVLDNFVIAVSEVVTNAIRHGRAPVHVKLWTDRGPGPKDPYAGLLPRTDGEPGGLGLWLTHQLCDFVTLDRPGDGFTIRLTVNAE